ncbi:MAG: UbiD family decarboxylase [Saprospiraceae bacterium]
MAYNNLQDACLDLEKNQKLIQIDELLDPDQVIPEIHRRVYAVQGPALLFNNVKGSPFRAVSNLFGTFERSEFLFRHVMKKLEWLIKIKKDPISVFHHPLTTIQNLGYLVSALPKRNYSNQLNQKCHILDLPQIKSWPDDGGAFITLPQVISFPPNSLDPKKANVGMYRIQLSGNDYINNEEIGLHYQLHRGIGNHHLQYLQSKEDFKISIAVGGPPAYTLASIFPLPENLSEILFSGILNGKRYSYYTQDGFLIPQDVDFCITGTVNLKNLKTEGPFGDHLGYYSLKHPFPYLENLNVYHKKNAIWPFTVVGRPPQEDSSFGFLIHQIVAELTTTEFPGIKEIHAVDQAGVHPLLLAIGSERYMPFRDRKPEEILTLANHLLGKGQTSLAKYLFIAADEKGTELSTKNIPAFFNYILERVDWSKDLHFFTNTTMDTLDYSGGSWNAGSKVVIACNRNKLRNLDSDLSCFHNLPESFHSVSLIQSGIVCIQGTSFLNYQQTILELKILTDYFERNACPGFPLIILCDNTKFITENYNNFIWSCFTKSNPAYDIYGANARYDYKHWACETNLIIDARTKPHHAPPLIVDPKITQKVDAIISNIPSLNKLFK